MSLSYARSVPACLLPEAPSVTYLVVGAQGSRIQVGLIGSYVDQVEFDHPTFDPSPIRQRSRFITNLVESRQSVVITPRLANEGLKRSVLEMTTLP